MKITRRQLRQIIQEELRINETSGWPVGVSSGWTAEHIPNLMGSASRGALSDKAYGALINLLLDIPGVEDYLLKMPPPTKSKKGSGRMAGHPRP